MLSHLWPHRFESEVEPECCHARAAVGYLSKEELAEILRARGNWELVIVPLPFFAVYRVKDEFVEIVRVIHGAILSITRESGWLRAGVSGWTISGKSSQWLDGAFLPAIE